MAQSTHRSRAKHNNHPYLQSRVNRALLNFVQEVGRTTIEAVNMYSFFLNYQRAIVRHGSAYARELKKIQNERELKRRLQELKRQRFIEARFIGNRLELRLTDYGRVNIFLERLNKQRDGGAVFTLVFFDVPETERLVRRQFRLFLKQAGFKLLQQSVWVRQADVYKTVWDVIHYLKAERWITVIRTADDVGR